MTQKEQTRQLWQLCFDDSEAFTDLYFRSRYTDQRNITVQENGQLIAAMQLLPYTMTFNRHLIQASYISGACTHPKARNRGVMKGLLTQSFEHMREQHVPLACLIPAEPWLVGYYGKSGFEPVFRYSTETITRPYQASASVCSCQIRVSTQFEEAVWQYLNRAISQRPWSIRHTRSDFMTITEDLTRLNSGIILVAEQNREICGVSIAYNRTSGWTIEELEADDASVRSQLIEALLSHVPAESTCTLYKPASEATDNLILGMARVVDAAALLRLYAQDHPDADLEIHLEDRQIQSNNGFYRLHQGQLTHQSHRQTDLPLLNLDSNGLCRFLFSGQYPRMTLMMN